VKKIVIVAVVLLLVVVGLGLVFGKKVLLAFASAETQACAKIGDLCGRDGSQRDLDACVNGLAQTRKAVGDEAVNKTLACIEDAETCVAASGCMVGGIGAGVVQELLKGIGDAVGR
jgi:hypothetical protein